MYTLQDALQGKPMPIEYLRQCNSGILQICYRSLETSLGYVRNQVESTEELIKILTPHVEGKPDREKDLQKLRASLDELILSVQELGEQQIRTRTVLEERGESVPY